jgi:hypothetical protein
MGKGSKPRPFEVDQKTFDNNWEQIFGKKKEEPKEVECKDDPRAPHGFDRSSSHSEDRYVCECENWSPPSTTIIDDLLYDAGLTAQGCWEHLGVYEKEAIERVILLTAQLCADSCNHSNDRNFIRKFFKIEEFENESTDFGRRDNNQQQGESL